MKSFQNLWENKRRTNKPDRRRQIKTQRITPAIFQNDQFVNKNRPLICDVHKQEKPRFTPAWPAKRALQQSNPRHSASHFLEKMAPPDFALAVTVNDRSCRDHRSCFVIHNKNRAKTKKSGCRE
jgi:hypothetical protein